MSGAVIAGVDPSIGSAAVVVGHHGLPVPRLHRRVFKAVDPAEHIVARMARWRAHAGAIRNYIATYDTDYIFIEGYSFGSRGAATLSLAEFGGVLRMALLSLCVPIIEVSPNSLKQFICGRGNANKTEVIAALARQHGVEYNTNDEYDALGLWLLGRAYHDADFAGNQTQTKVIEGLRGKQPYYKCERTVIGTPATAPT
jgi:Holliday junction resolvasome RuvABC endonuclease subunit